MLDLTDWNGKKDIKSMTPEEVTEELAALGEKSFRAKQLYEWMHVKLAKGFDDMSSLSKGLREKLGEIYSFTCLELVEERISKVDGTRKYLFGLEDGNVIESVWMQYHHGNSVCISSQVGCRMGCRFCASTLDGLERNLRPSEMLEQIYRIQALTGERVSNVVVMGSGSLWITMIMWCGFCVSFPMKTGSISARGISPFPPAAWFPRSTDLQRRACL